MITRLSVRKDEYPSAPLSRLTTPGFLYEYLQNALRLRCRIWWAPTKPYWLGYGGEARPEDLRDNLIAQLGTVTEDLNRDGTNITPVKSISRRIILLREINRRRVSSNIARSGNTGRRIAAAGSPVCPNPL